MGYLKLLAALGETNIIALSAPPCPTHNEAHTAKLLIVDMNWGTDDEEIAAEYLLEKFPHAQVLFMKEEQNQLSIQTHHDRTIHLLGKLAELDVCRHCLRELLAKVGVHTRSSMCGRVT